MKRREFISRAAMGLGAAWAAPHLMNAGPVAPPAPARYSASDVVTLGKTGIKTSRLAMGSGTVGVGHHSNQTALGIDGLADLFVNGYNNGVTFFDLADAYGSHPHAAAAPRAREGAMLSAQAEAPEPSQVIPGSLVSKLEELYRIPGRVSHLEPLPSFFRASCYRDSCSRANPCLS